jgi:hypothetical protein
MEGNVFILSMLVKVELSAVLKSHVNPHDVCAVSSFHAIGRSCIVCIGFSFMVLEECAVYSHRVVSASQDNS